jgi:hypothetical protein
MVYLYNGTIASLCVVFRRYNLIIWVVVIMMMMDLLDLSLIMWVLFWATRFSERGPFFIILSESSQNFSELKLENTLSSLVFERPCSSILPFVSSPRATSKPPPHLS